MEIVIIIGLILLNGLFSMSEIAVISSRKSSLTSEAKQGNNSAKAALKLANEPNRFLSTIQIGITLIGILTGIYSGDVLTGNFNVVLLKIGVPAAISYTLAQSAIVILVTYFTLIFGELVPKQIGMNMSEKVAKLIARPMNILSLIASPFVWILSKSTLLMVRIFRIHKNDAKVTEEEIRSILQEGTEDGAVKEVEQDIVERVFSLGDRDIESIMTHRSEIVWIDTDFTNEQICEMIQKHPYGTYPVANKNLDNILGVVSLKDLFGKIDKSEFNIEQAIRPTQYFHESMEVYKALDIMKSSHVNYALVCDEFGSIQGVVTYKDILEGLVGSLPTETEEPEITKRTDGGWYVDGQCPFYDFLEYFDLEDLYPEYEYNTISGLILDQLGEIPKTGDRTEWKAFTFEIADMDGARIDKVLVTRREDYKEDYIS